MRRYVDLQHAQVRELMTLYGPIDLLWYDGGYFGSEGLRATELNAMVRRLQPQILINDRSGLPEDITTPEGHSPLLAPSRPWELCSSTHVGWGIEADDPSTYRPVPELLAMLSDTVALGGNLLLNVGPQADGRFPPIVNANLGEVGRWMKANGGAIHGAIAGPLGRQQWGVSTWKPGVIYLHVFRPSQPLIVQGLLTTVQRAYVLESGADVPFRQREGCLELDIAAVDPVATVVALALDGEPQTVRWSLTTAGDGRVILPANAATIHGATTGGTLFCNPDARGGQLCYWTRADEYPSWSFTLERGGNFNVLTESSNIDMMAGTPFEVSVGGHSLQGVATSSGSWYAFRTDCLGVARAPPAGQHELTVRAADITSGGLMCLRAVLLDPAE